MMEVFSSYKGIVCGEIPGLWEVSSSGKGERTYFLAQHTLLQVCHHVGAVLEKSTTIIAW